MVDKQQFNVYLSPDLVRRVKHAAVDHAVSLSAFVEQSLSDHLDRLTAAPSVERAGGTDTYTDTDTDTAKGSSR
jgi:predicted transcriptional regulator